MQTKIGNSVMKNPAALKKSIKTTADILKDVTLVIEAAGDLKEALQPVINAESTQEVTNKAKVAMDENTPKIKKSINGAISKVADAKNNVAAAYSSKKNAKNLAKQLKKAKQYVLESASQTITYKEFKKQRDGISAAGDALTTGLYAGSGCFIIATYSNFDHDHDLTDYLNVYVGSGLSLGVAIEEACSRNGDPDVYADVKYKQNVYIYSYPCLETQLSVKNEALIELFLSNAIQK